MTTAPAVNNPDDLLTVDETADLLRMTADGLRYAIYAGTAPKSARIGKRRLFRRADVDEYIANAFN